MTTINVAIYARISSEHQRDNTSITTQIEDCKAYARHKGWTVYDVYVDEAKSGRKAQREELQRLRLDVQARRVQAVLVWKLDRLARQSRDYHNMVKEFEQHHAIVDSVTEHLDLATSGGRLSAGVLAQIAQFSSDMLSERVIRALKHKAEHGQWVGPVPLGYVKQGDTLAPSDDAPAIRLAFQLYANGDASYTSIADRLNELGYRALIWQTGERQIFGRESIRWILKNRAYCGYVSSGGTEYPGTHEPLVTEEMWQQVADIREARNRSNGRIGLHQAGLISGLAHCAACGALLWQHHSGKKDRAILYYRCAGLSRRQCNAPMYRLDMVDNEVLTLIRSIELPQRIIEKALTGLQARVKTPPAVRQQRTKKDIEAALARYAEVYADGAISREAYLKKREALTAQLAALSQDAPPPPRLDLQRAAQLLGDMPSLLVTATPATQRGIIRTIFEKLWILDKKVHAITPHQVYMTLLGAMACVVRVADGSQPHTAHTPAWLEAPMWVAQNVSYTHNPGNLPRGAAYGA